MTQFELVFKGELAENFAVDQVKTNVGKLFKASPAQVEHMFSGKPVVLRNRLDSATAKKYLAILRKNGAVCSLREMANASSPGQGTTASHKTEVAAEKKVTTKKVTTTTGLPVAGEQVDSILADVHWNIAPPGARLEVERTEIPLPEHDLSHLTIAPAGSDMGERKKSAAPPPPDTSHLTLKN